MRTLTIKSLRLKFPIMGIFNYLDENDPMYVPIEDALLLYGYQFTKRTKKIPRYLHLQEYDKIRIQKINNREQYSILQAFNIPKIMEEIERKK